MARQHLALRQGQLHEINADTLPPLITTSDASYFQLSNCTSDSPASHLAVSSVQMRH